MSTAVQTLNETTTLFRGPTLEALLPQIREQLGPDAVVVRRRDGVTGGIAGFFRRRCVEIEARPGRAGIDTYDDPGEAAALALRSALDTEGDEPADAAIGEGLRAPAIRALIGSAAPFAEHLAAAAESAGGDDDIGDDQPAEPPAEVPSAGARRPGAADTLEKALVEGGVSARLAAEVVAETVSHLLPFGTPRQLKRLVRRALARRISVQGPRALGGAALVFAGAGGAGKTLTVARLAAAYAARSDLDVVVVALRPRDGGAELAGLLHPAGVPVEVF